MRHSVNVPLIPILPSEQSEWPEKFGARLKEIGTR